MTARYEFGRSAAPRSFDNSFTYTCTERAKECKRRAKVTALRSVDVGARSAFAANELHAFAGERGVRVVPTPVPSTQANNAQRSTPNVSMEAAPFEVFNVGR